MTVHDRTKRHRPRRKWWQWILLYPTLVAAFIGAVPQYIDVAKAHFYEVPLNQVFSAETQNKLWTKNLDCAKTLSPQVTTEEHILVSVIACASGDVLVDVKYPDGKEIYRWIPFTTLQTAHSEFPP